MKEVVSQENMRKSDEYTIKNHISSKELMHRAAYGIYKNLPLEKFDSPSVLVVTGTGNNAGDGYALALILKENKISPSLVLIEERFSADGAYYFEKCKEAGINYSLYQGENLKADIIVDCIFGTGFKGEPRAKYKDAIEKINSSGAYVVCADINSGLNGDSGLGSSVVKSDITVSIGTIKSGHLLNMAKDKIGKLVNEDIGIKIIEKPYYLFEEADARALLKKREQFSNKGTYGYVTLIGGSFEYSGAIKLANIASSAMRAGAGVVRLATQRSIGHAVMPYLLESTLYPLSENENGLVFNENEIQGAQKGVKAIGVGMGLGLGAEKAKIINYLLESTEVPMLFDADALNIISKEEISLKKAKAPVLLTPHLKELERLTKIPLEKIQESPIEIAKSYAKENGVILLLKGTATIVTDGDEVVIINRGCAGMATAGSGDVLSGIITSLLAQISSPFSAVCLGAYINGLAGEIAEKKNGAISMVASDTASCVKDAILKITK